MHRAVLLPLGVGYYACWLGGMKDLARNFEGLRRFTTKVTLHLLRLKESGLATQL